jgi:tRNA threonylcarbamoyladenosine biosynthesis protein TsaE
MGAGAVITYGMGMQLLTLDDERQTEGLGGLVAGRLALGDAVCLFGPLGAGKSTLARALIRALTHADEEVPSPTFTLVQTYRGKAFEIAHFDLYRLSRPEEAFELGLDDALGSGAVVIEWPERLGGDLPADRLEIHLAAGQEASARIARLQGYGAWIGRDRF